MQQHIFLVTDQQPKPAPDTPADNPTDDSKKDATPKTGDGLPVLPLGMLLAASAIMFAVARRNAHAE